MVVVVDLVKETQLLGVIVNDRLTWDIHSSYLVQRANARMRLLHKLVSVSITQDE